jgi:hypothetical protein
VYILNSSGYLFMVYILNSSGYLFMVYILNSSGYLFTVYILLTQFVRLNGVNVYCVSIQFN